AMTMSDRICLMNAGSIAQLGTPADLYFRPKSVFVADFLGESNLLDAVVTGRSGDQVQISVQGGANVNAMAYDSVISDGKQVKLMLRPQNLQIHDGPPAESINGGTLSAKLTDIMVTGSMTKLYLQSHISNAAPLVAAFPTNRLGRQYEIGQSLGLSWLTADAVAIAG
ncbi:MAG TPA: TOBE domain-containing protein, partial [Caballeronia sp.]|nr:TOBE domain-containing protein [Caballeronia sp.]